MVILICILIVIIVGGGFVIKDLKDDVKEITKENTNAAKIIEANIINNKALTKKLDEQVLVVQTTTNRLREIQEDMINTLNNKEAEINLWQTRYSEQLRRAEALEIELNEKKV